MRAGTWKDFKREVEKQGIDDDSEIEFIDYNPDHTFSGVDCHKNADGKWVIVNEPY